MGRAERDSESRLAPGRTGAAARRLKVAHVAPGFGIGGLEKMLVDFARRTDRARFEPRFIAIGEDGPVGAEMAALGLPVTAMGKGDGLKPLTMLRLARLLRRERIDVVHTHNATGLFYGAPAARLAGVRRVIHTRHGVEPISAKAMLALRAAARLVDRIVCVSRDNAALARQEGFPGGKLVTLLNGVDVERFACRGLSGRQSAIVVSRLSPEKDLATLLRAIALLRKKGSPITLDIVGDGPCRGALEALAAELGLGEAVRFHGQRGDVREALAAAGLFVLPSLTEGVSLTLLEAMATGLPVVATAVGGNVEVVADGETGRLAPPGDPRALADAMAAILADPEAARAMGQRGRRRAEVHFDLRRAIAAYEALYEG